MIRTNLHRFTVACLFAAACIVITIFAVVRFDVDKTSITAVMEHGHRALKGRLRPFVEKREKITLQNKFDVNTDKINKPIINHDGGKIETNGIIIQDGLTGNKKKQSITTKGNRRNTSFKEFISGTKQHFIVVTQPRCGSNLLDSYLNQHPLVTSYNELIQRPIFTQLNLPPEPSRKQIINYVAGVLGISNTPEPRNDLSGSGSGTRTGRSSNLCESCMISTGFKIHLTQMIKYNISLQSFLIKLKRPKIILLYRKNLLEQYVSWQIAAVTRLWWSTDIQNTVSHKLKLNQLKHFVRTERILWFNLIKMLKNSQYIEGSDYTVVSYEDLVADKTTTMNEVFSLLGYKEENRHLFTWLLKQNPMPLNKKISNYIEMKPYLEQLDCTLHLD